eukprot:10552679-Prorocentrum_lima.AAC.1
MKFQPCWCCTCPGTNNMHCDVSARADHLPGSFSILTKGMLGSLSSVTGSWTASHNSAWLRAE